MVNNKNGAASDIPPNKEVEKLEAEELIKSNKSAMQQLMDANEQINDLKTQLLDREAKMMAMQDAINNILTQVNGDANALYKEVNKNLVVLSDVVKGMIEPSLIQTFQQIRTQIPYQQKVLLSRKFREAEGLEPLQGIKPPSSAADR